MKKVNQSGARIYQVFKQNKGFIKVTYREYIIYKIKLYKKLRLRLIDISLGFGSKYHLYERNITVIKYEMRGNLINIKWALEERRWHRFSKLLKKMLRESNKNDIWI